MEWFVGVIGLFIGSFLNVLMERLPKGQNVVVGRSHCDHCKKILRWYELIPLISYILQAGRCRRCHAPLSLQYPLIELLTGILFMLLYQRFGTSLQEFAAVLVIFSAYFVMTVTDSNYQIIPDSMVVTSVIGTLILYAGRISGADSVLHLAAAGAAGLLFYLLWYGTKGRGMGFGDVKLAAALGLLLGFPLTIFALYIAFLTGACVGVILILKGSKTLKSKLAFGPFLLFGTTLSFICQTYFLHVWNTLF